MDIIEDIKSVIKDTTKTVGEAIGDREKKLLYSRLQSLY